ncbi:MAG TPA: hypothetical protein VGR44_03080, partial [Methylomirabilota bacterium]|nr:hypothetical protein [Methylomirabilota bacterium]
HLVSRMAADNPMFQDRVDELARQLANSGLGSYQAHQQTYARLYRIVLNQAQTLAYIDTFWLLAVASAVMFCLAFALKKNDLGGGGVVLE